MTPWKTLTKQDSQARTLSGLIMEADAVVVGIGAGMSAADGFTYVGPRFEKAFADFIARYHWFDMLQASLYDFPDWEEYWAFQSRFVALNYLDQPVGRSYLKLRSLLDQKPHHIITTNADNAFWAAGYDPRRVFHIQGEYGLMQCSEHCHQQTYQNDRLIRRMVEEQEHMRVPSRLIPRCPRCGAPMEVNKRNEKRGMVEDADFAGQRARYEAFLARHCSGQVLYLEIGVGTTTPQFIKHPFWRMVGANEDALLVTLNHKDYRIPRQLRARSVHLDQNIASLIAEAS